MSIRSATILVRLRARRLRTSLLGRLLPSGCHILDVSGLDKDGVIAHLRRCCGPAHCCSEMIADMMDCHAE